jgi:hypothetical protein
MEAHCYSLTPVHPLRDVGPALPQLIHAYGDMCNASSYIFKGSGIYPLRRRKGRQGVRRDVEQA